MTKISVFSQDTSPTTDDQLTSLDTTTGANKRLTIADLITLIFNNIPTGSPSPITRQSEFAFDFIASGLVWSGDAYASTRAASMTAGIIYINGRRISIGVVTSRSFTASKDTYIDILDNLNGTGTVVYTEVTNNAASPALAANSVRIGIIVTGASNIASAGSVNQGQESKVLPIASSIPYTVTDSLGNLICPRDSARKLLGYRQITSGNLTTSSTSVVQLLGLTMPIIAPANRKVRISIVSPSFYVNSGSVNGLLSLWEGTVGSGTQLQEDTISMSATNQQTPTLTEAVSTPSSSSKTYNAGFRVSAGTGVFVNGSGMPAFIKAELL